MSIFQTANVWHKGRQTGGADNLEKTTGD